MVKLIGKSRNIVINLDTIAYVEYGNDPKCPDCIINFLAPDGQTEGDLVGITFSGDFATTLIDFFNKAVPVTEEFARRVQAAREWNPWLPRPTPGPDPEDDPHFNNPR